MLPQAGEARGSAGDPGVYLWGWELRGAGWHCRMMLRMSWVGRGKCSELSRECRTGSPGHRRPTAAAGPSTRLRGPGSVPRAPVAIPLHQDPLPAFCE